MRSFKEFTSDVNEMRRATENWKERKVKEEQMFIEWLDEIDVGDRCHIQHWSDIDPCTVIKRTRTTVTVRYDDAVLSDNWEPEWIAGGFSAICVNQDKQEWEIFEDPNGSTEVFRWHKVGGWFNKCGERLWPEWRKYYDYNF